MSLVGGTRFTPCYSLAIYSQNEVFPTKTAADSQTFDLRCLELRRLVVTAGAQLLEHGGDPHPVHGHARAATLARPHPSAHASTTCASADRSRHRDSGKDSAEEATEVNLVDLVQATKKAADEAREESRRSTQVMMKLREEVANMRQQSNAVDSHGTADKLDLSAKRALFHSPKFVLAVNPFEFNNICIVTSAVNKDWLAALSTNLMTGLSNGKAPDHSAALVSLVRFCVLNNKGAPRTQFTSQHTLTRAPCLVCIQSTMTTTSCSSRTTAKCSTRTSWLRSPAAKTPRQVSPATVYSPPPTHPSPPPPPLSQQPSHPPSRNPNPNLLPRTISEP